MKNRPAKPSICLNMIVKDESHVILRCLESVKDVIDYWVISDTGSTDGTQQIIRDFFTRHQIPGELHEHPWKHFAHNRNLVLDLARDKADYLFMMDADDEFIHPPGFQFAHLTEGSYYINCILHGVTYARRHLIRTDLPWKWNGVIHETLECSHPFTTPVYPEGHIVASTEGARGQNPDRFKADIAVLKAALVEEPDNTRYQFYLAQSYRDDGNLEQALQEYQKRAEMGGWEEEVYFSLFEVGRIQARLGKPQSQVLESLLQAYAYRPRRLEALYHAVRICRHKGHYQLGYHLGHAAVDTPLPDDVLFVSASIYEWQFKDEIAVCASWIQRKPEAKKLFSEIIKLETLSDQDRERLTTNIACCE